MSNEGKLLRLEKRHKGLARVTAAINDLYIYGVYESNYPALMDTLNLAKDACKEELRDTHIEIVSVTKANEITKLTPSTEEQLQEDFEG
jgi:hypothetical protein|tara:strand:- start:295 stop:561 length:267 start_codon:yes stop_codon:yes gene_type:complete